MTSRELVDPMASVRAYLAASSSSATRRAYASDWADFTTWCGQVLEQPFPALPETIARYLAQLADGGSKTSTIQRRIAALAAAHRAAGFDPPPTSAEGVRATMRGIRRSLGAKPTRKAPTTAELLGRVLHNLPKTLQGLRDRAILVVSFAAALRRSELVALHVHHIERRSRGIVIHIDGSKTDQEGKGEQLPVPNGRQLRPVDALDAWLEAAGITEGPIFREVDRHGKVGLTPLSGRSIARIVKRAVKACGLDESIFSGHSMRAGFVTTALADKQDPLKVAKISRHKKIDTLRIYDRKEADFDDHAGGGFL